jgi:coenzyme F420-0:L-glutamate ligase / coenzyme F420-1:gamma-L-glutamate ligase
VRRFPGTFLWEREFVAAHRVARLATVAADGQPHVVPIVYVLDAEQLFTPLDGKPKQVPLDKLQRVRNLAVNDRVAVVVDDYDEDWTQLAWVQLRGRATLLEAGDDYQLGLRLLQAKYPQYATVPLLGRPLIQIRIEAVRSWRMI